MIKSIIWKILVFLVFLRPFLSEYAFPILGFWYIFALISFSCLYLFFERKLALFSSPLNVSLFVFIVGIFISMIFSGYTPWSLLELYYFFPNILIFYIVSNISLEQQKQLINAIFWAAVIVCIYSIHQYLVVFKHLSEYLKQTAPDEQIEWFLSRKRVYSTFISPNLFASYIMMMLFLGLGFLVSFKQKKKIIYLICVFVMGAALLLTKSLGSILVFIITFLLFSFITVSYLFPRLKLKRTVLKRISFGTIVVLSGYLLTFGIAISGRLPLFFKLNNCVNPFSQRIYYWQSSLEMIHDFPWAGIGWRQFGSLYYFYRLPASRPGHYSHNVFLQITAEMGVLGLLSFISIVAISFWKGFRGLKDNSQVQGLKIGLFCAGIAFLLYNLIDISFYFGQVCFFWWIILGLLSIKNVSHSI